LARRRAEGRELDRTRPRERRTEFEGRQVERPKTSAIPNQREVELLVEQRAMQIGDRGLVDRRWPAGPPS